MIKKLKIGDILIVILILLFSVSMFFVSKNRIKSSNNSDKYAIIQIDGKEVQRVKLDSTTIGKKIPIETKFGYNLLEVGDGSIRSIEASCPDKIDVKQGFISKVGETIVCLPNRLVVEIIDKVDVDGIDLVN